jgi:K+-sensing histidine kinase KdpD
MSSSDTKFAPAEKVDIESILRDAEALKETGLIEHIIHVIPSILMVLNRQLQIVYKNQRLMELLGATSDQDVLGKRPGEIFNCIHAHESAAGCGTTKFCRECGAVKAILQSQQQQVEVEEECRITTTSGDAYEFRVWASPYTYDGTEYTIFSLQDIGDEKRREVLERTLFHDVNNILFLIVAHSRTASYAENKKHLDECIENIQLTTRNLAAEIASLMKHLEAEKRTLSVDLTNVVTASELVDELVYTFSCAMPNRRIVKGKDCDDFCLITDQTLLRRVLYNMLKNAIEASSCSEVVSIRHTQKESFGVFSVHNSRFMPRSTQLQVFQRSFSTKGKGRGIGTYSMKLFGEKYLKGKVWFSTTEDKGTTFFISVPLSYEDA